MKVFENLKLSATSLESGWHKSVEHSFLFISPAEECSSPDDLVLELYREVFFENRYEGENEKKGLLKRINPEEEDNNNSPVFSEGEKIALYIGRGRAKQTSQKKKTETYFTPLYPTLARTAWLRKQFSRSIYRIFFRSIAQHLHGLGVANPKERETNFISHTYGALHGKYAKDLGRLDIAGLEVDPLLGCIDEEAAKEKLAVLCSQFVTGKGSRKHKTPFILHGKQPDPLATVIFDDFMNLCELEKELDRFQWMNLLKTFLRFSSSVWLMAQMKMTIIIRDKLLSILSGESGVDIDHDWLDNAIQKRADGLFRPTSTKTKQIDKYVEQYVKARSELNVLVALVEKYSKSDWDKKSITLHPGGASDLSILELMQKGLAIRSDLDAELDGLSLRKGLTRHCEKYPAWTQGMHPTKGPGKNFGEYLLVLRKWHEGDEDGGYLVIPSKQKNGGVTIFPGNLMLALMTHLACRKNHGKQLIFADIEAHFRKYGLDFSEKGDIRPKLIEAMQDMGLLKGTPDAGESVSVMNPYTQK